MEIKIENGRAIGVIKVKRIFLNDPTEGVIYYAEKPLYDFHLLIWEDIETNTLVIKMRGSIVSMMQYRKYLLMNRPRLRDFI